MPLSLSIGWSFRIRGSRDGIMISAELKSPPRLSLVKSSLETFF